MSKKDINKAGDFLVHNYLVDISQQTEADLVLGTKMTTPMPVGGSDYLVELAVEQPASKTYNSSVKLQSLRDAHIQYTGQVTGKSYEWIRAGSVQVVDILDAPFLLEKRIKTQSCCSGNDVAVFQKID